MSLFDQMNKDNVALENNRSAQSVILEREQAYSSASALETNKLIRNTYTLLSITLLFSAFTAAIAMYTNMPRLGILPSLIGMLGLLFLTSHLKNSAWGLVAVLAFTGFMGLTLGPVINMYLKVFSNGHQLVMMAFGTTGAVFLGLSGYALSTRKDFSFMGAFLFTGLIVALVAALANLFLQIPALQLALSAIMVLLMAGYILYDTSNMVHGRETNYIMATVNLYVNIYNMFVSLLSLFGLMGESN